LNEQNQRKPGGRACERLSYDNSIIHSSHYIHSLFLCRCTLLENGFSFISIIYIINNGDIFVHSHFWKILSQFVTVFRSKDTAFETLKYLFLKALDFEQTKSTLYSKKGMTVLAEMLEILNHEGGSSL